MFKRATKHSDQLPLIWITPDHPEWGRMWEHLRDRTGSFDDPCPDSGERWQYMGSYQATSAVIVHTFRHRMRPTRTRINGVTHLSLPHCGRVVLDLVASEAYHEEAGLDPPDEIVSTVWSCWITDHGHWLSRAATQEHRPC